MNEQNDTLKLYKARVYDSMSNGDDRLKVRILPFMADLDGNDLDYLPIYPPLFKGQAPKYYTEINPNPDTKSGDLIWVIANYDFTFGYVLGPANVFGEYSKAMVGSWNYEESLQVAERNSSEVSEMNYSDLSVTLQNPNNTLVEFMSIKTGAKWIMNSYGSMIFIGDDSIVLTARNGVGTGNRQYSQINMRSTGIQIITPVIEFSAQKIVLGHSNKYLVATDSEAAICCDGQNLNSITRICV